MPICVKNVFATFGLFPLEERREHQIRHPANLVQFAVSLVQQLA